MGVTLIKGVRLVYLKYAAEECQKKCHDIPYTVIIILDLRGKKTTFNKLLISDEVETQNDFKGTIFNPDKI